MQSRPRRTGFPPIFSDDYGWNEQEQRFHALKSGRREGRAVAILEGTGTCSYFWKEQIQKKGIFVLVAD
jgi:hypothetical protein